MTKIRIILENDLGESIALKFYELGTDFHCTLEWEETIINGNPYCAVRIILSQHNKALFIHPMLLITNQVITTLEEALEVYKGYLLRFKIEVVFKFLKQNLGWEDWGLKIAEKPIFEIGLNSY